MRKEKPQVEVNKEGRKGEGIGRKGGRREEEESCKVRERERERERERGCFCHA